MMECMDLFQPSLFQSEPAFPKERLAAALRELAGNKIFIGTSSWRYEGWLGQFYTPERYLSRGRFSKTKFQEECILEYAEVFPVVGGDFSFYAAPTPEFWKKLFSRAPRGLKWSLKAPEDFTVKRFPKHPRYGPRGGLTNPSFLDAASFEAAFLEPVSPYLDRVSVVIFEFGAFSRETYSDPQQFCDELGAFLDHLPRTVSYSIELRNSEFLSAAYFDVLGSHGVAHVLNSWTRMPSLSDQLEIDRVFTAPHTVARALLRPGRGYDQSVALFSPYSEVREPYPEGRDALRQLIRRSRERHRSAYVHVNNRFEGNAIETIRAIVE